MVSVIIASSLTTERWPLLRRLLDSLESQDVDEVVVVVNGTGVQSDALVALKARTDVKVAVFGAIGLRRARYEGLLIARGSLIQFIDDDDELLPGAIKNRRDALSQHGWSMVVSDGYLVRNGVATPAPASGVAHITSPQLAILEENWNASLAALYRASAFKPDIFLELPVMEWTALGFFIAREHGSVGFVSARDYRVNDTGDSLSKQAEYARSEVESLLWMVPYAADDQVRQRLDDKITQAFHHAARYEWSAGSRAAAWRNHLVCLRRPGGLRFVGFTLRLILPVPRAHDAASGTDVPNAR